jgi:adenine-specific DNA-methyltransferase
MDTLPGTMPDHPALTSALITYIGNKRALLPFIWQGMERIADRIGPIRSMADPFTGSGVVARLGRLAGIEVHAGDIEAYTRPFGTAFLETSPAEVESLFAADGGYRNTLARLNALTAPTDPAGEYFARHYAPADTATADPDRERLFYTRENALRIDAMLEAIHREWEAVVVEHGGTPAASSPDAMGAAAGTDPAPAATAPPVAAASLAAARQRRDILLASLLVEMSVHNNTSGVMKGFHHGWGGRGGDALGRIMAPVELEPIPFIDGPVGSMRIGPAEELLAQGHPRGTDAPDHPLDTAFAAGGASAPAGRREFDLVYLDPPYTIHQYGANYHLLTSAVRRDFWDPGPVERGRRAGIREDHYRSAYCSNAAGRARAALEGVLDAARTRSFLISYNNDGIIAPEEMLALLGEDGINSVELLSRRYHKFRGGKATQGAVRTREYLFLVLRGHRQARREREAVRDEVRRLAAERDLHDRFLIPSRWIAGGGGGERGSDGTWNLTGPSGETVVLDNELRVQAMELPGGDEPEPQRIDEAVARIEAATGDPVAAAEALLAAGDCPGTIRLLKRLKIRKYRGEFSRLADALEARELSESERRQVAALRARVEGRRA